jgi:hypothetical protein
MRVGYALALEKPTILLATSHADLTAFDLKTYQHGFHSGRATEARRILQNIFQLPGLLRTGLAEPGETILFDWPVERARLRWDAPDPNFPDKHDVFGGQIDIRTPGVGPLLVISDTESRGNWQRGDSIMSFGTIHRPFNNGDEVILRFLAHGPNAWRAIVLGDIGDVDSNTFGKAFDGKWDDIHPVSGWSTYELRSQVQVIACDKLSGIRRPGDFSWLSRGIHFLLGTHLGPSLLLIRKLTLVRIPKAHAGNVS